MLMVFVPSKDYEKIYADDDTYFAGHGHIYERLEIDPKAGCVVVVRPDQYVSLVCRVDEFERIGELLEALLACFQLMRSQFSQAPSSTASC